MTDVFPDFSRRSREHEIMDGADFTREEVRAAYADLRRVNTYLGGTAALLRHLAPMLATVESHPVKVLDVGTGSADIPRAIVEAAREQSIDVRVVAVDASAHALAAAAETVNGAAEISLVQAAALQLPFADNSFDFVIASELLHHLDDERAAMFLRRLAQLARVAFVINDLRRHPIPYFTFQFLSRLFTSNRLIRHDGLVSILRGFTAEDIRQLQRRAGLARLDVHHHFPYRLVLIGKS